MDTIELLRKVRKIEIKAKGKAQDILSGAYHSAFKGIGMSFAETRSYQYGDDVRNIDWNVTARTGETQVKIFEEERELTIFLLIDVSASQGFGSSVMKNELIAEIAGVLAINAMRNHDKVGAILFSDKIECYIPPKKGKSNALRIIREMLNFDNTGKKTNISAGLHFFNAIQRKRSVCFLISDFMDKHYDNAMKIVKKKHDLIPVKMTDPYEYKLPNLGLMRIKDAETGNELLVDTNDKRWQKQLQNQFSKHTTYFDGCIKKYGIRPIHIATNEDYIKPFIKYFKSR